MKTSSLFLIGCLLLALLVNCAANEPETLILEPTAVLALHTNTPLPSTVAPIPATDTPVPPTLNAVSIAMTQQALTREVATPRPTNTPIGGMDLDTETIRNIVYANVDEKATDLDVYAPSEGNSWPVVIVVHGVLQDKNTFVALAETIASQGAVVYNINVEHTFPSTIAIEHIGCAVRFARAMATDYGGDPSRITLVGNSAGANTGVIVALSGDDFGEDCVVTNGSAQYDAFVGYEGAYHIATTVFPYPYDHSFLKDEDPELWQAIDPYFHIGLNSDLQIRLVHGDDADTAWYDFSPDVSTDYYQALVDAGYDVELTVMEGRSHTALTRSTSAAFALIVEQVMEVAGSSSQ